MTLRIIKFIQRLNYILRHLRPLSNYLTFYPNSENFLYMFYTTVINESIFSLELPKQLLNITCDTNATEPPCMHQSF